MLVQAVLTYRPHGIGTEAAVPLGSTDDSRVLRVLRDAIVADAQRDAELWAEVDPGVLALKAAELERLARIFAVLLPDESLRPALRAVKKPDGAVSSSSPDAAL